MKVSQLNTNGFGVKSEKSLEDRFIPHRKMTNTSQFTLYSIKEMESVPVDSEDE